jgi:ankyrin repeat protein
MARLLSWTFGGNLEVLSSMLEAKPDVNAQSDSGWSALMFASQSGIHAAVAALL